MIADDIYHVFKTGTSVNPGLPDPLAGYAVAQAAWESADFNSHVFQVDHNLNGYKWVGSRYQTGPGLPSPEGDNYGHYGSYQDSAKELVDWIYRRVRDGVFPLNLSAINSPKQYAQLLKDADYYGDPVDKYAKGLEFWLKKYSVPVAEGTGGILLLTIILWFSTRTGKKNT